VSLFGYKLPRFVKSCLFEGLENHAFGGRDAVKTVDGEGEKLFKGHIAAYLSRISVSVDLGHQLFREVQALPSHRYFSSASASFILHLWYPLLDTIHQMLVNRAYKVELDPNNVQRTLLLKHAGAARWAYNWGLEQKIKCYKASRQSPSAFDLHRALNVLKTVPTERGGVPWMYEVSKCAPQQALRNLDDAYRRFFRRRTGRDCTGGFPRFKSRRGGVGSFTLTGVVKVSLEGTHIQLPRLGKLRLKERGYLPTSGAKMLSATVSERAGRWFVSLSAEEDRPEPKPSSGVLGVDVGINHLAVTSEGEVFENPRALSGALKRLRRLSKTVSRRQKGSKNRRKAKLRLARQHYRVSCIRRDAIHKATTMIAKSAGMIVIEDLNVAGMLKNRRLSRALADASLSDFHRQLEYKAEWYGATLVKADRFYPSSKRCSRCGHVKETLGLGERTYRCEACGLVMDRDLNAACNLEILAVSSTVSACRQGSAGPARKGGAKLPSGQEAGMGLVPS